MQHDNAHPVASDVSPSLPIIPYAPSTLRSRLSFSERVAIAVLAIGALAYSVACIPAYSRRSWPPLDRLSEAMPWLWFFPIPMFTLLMSGGRLSRRILLLYAVLTGGIDAWTFPFCSMNPHPSFDTELWFANLISTVPLHLAITPVIALLSRSVYGLLGVSPSLGTMPKRNGIPRASIALIVGIVVVAAMFPFVYQHWTLSEDSGAGAQMADADWAIQKATIIANNDGSYRQVNGYSFASFFDQDSGFPFKESWAGRWEPGYNAEIRSLIKSRGIPTWSLKNRFVDDADMMSILTATNMREITSYPCVLSPNIVLFRGGGVTPWGTTIVSDSKYLDIQSRNQNNTPIGSLGEENDPAFVGQLPKYPGTFFVRCGKAAVACTADGWIFQYVSDDR